MPVRFSHSRYYGIDEIIGYFFMEEVAHGVYEYRSRGAPMKRKIDDILVECNFKSVPVVWLPHRLEPFCHPLGIAMFAACAYLRTAGDGIPAALCPFDRGSRQGQSFIRISRAIFNAGSIAFGFPTAKHSIKRGLFLELYKI